MRDLHQLNFKQAFLALQKGAPKLVRALICSVGKISKLRVAVGVFLFRVSIEASYC